MKHLLSLESLATAEIHSIFRISAQLKKNRRLILEGDRSQRPLHGQTWAMIFTKSSTRTRVSFEVGIHELGGNPLFLNANDIQLGRGEPIKDTARVLGRMVHGIIIRTFAQKDVEELAEFSGIPVINALTDDEHPCQILTDIFTYEEKHGSIKGKVVAFIGDGACNVPISWVFAAARLGFTLRIVAPAAYQPTQQILQRAAAIAARENSGGKIELVANISEGLKGADLVYTDVWVSMGKEAEAAQRLKDLANYQINAQHLSHAKRDALVMHCLPAYRGKEIDEASFEQHAQTIFDQAENRLHVQKAILSLIER